MENLENKKQRKAFETNTSELADWEVAIIAKSENLNKPALAAFFGVTEDQIEQALSKKK